MKNSFDNSINFRKSDDFEFIGYDDNDKEVVYAHCEDNYKSLYEVSLAFANRAISEKCASFVVRDLWLNDDILRIYRDELIASEESKAYEIACQIIARLCEV